MSYKIRKTYRDDFKWRLKRLITKSVEYTIVESYKIYKETESSEFEIKDLRKYFMDIYLVELDQYKNVFFYDEEESKRKTYEIYQKLVKEKKIKLIEL